MGINTNIYVKHRAVFARGVPAVKTVENFGSTAFIQSV
jgi:hypothetical protein